MDEGKSVVEEEPLEVCLFVCSRSDVGRVVWTVIGEVVTYEGGEEGEKAEWD